MRPTDVLKQEHRTIERMLRTLMVTSKRMQKGEEIDPQVYAKAVDFIRTFADKCHHGKEEDNLFPAIERQGFPREGGPVGMMLMEHEEGRDHVRQLASALEKYEKGNRSEAIRANIFGHAIGYAQLLAQHIQKEDNILYDIADNVIPRAEQTSLLDTFEEVQQRTVGNGKYDEYVRLAEELETLTQAQNYRL